MRSLGVPYCHVCAEALVRSIYALVRLVDSSAPANALPLQGSQTETLSVFPLVPSTHVASITWNVDGQPRAHATASYIANAKQLGNGAHVVAALLADSTSFVRSDSTLLLHDVKSWNISVTNASSVTSSAIANSPGLIDVSPNPFDDETTLHFPLAHSGNVRVTVYSVAGSEIATLTDGMMLEGKHDVVWHAGALPAGVYVYRALIGGQTKTGMLLHNQ